MSTQFIQFSFRYFQTHFRLKFSTPGSTGADWPRTHSHWLELACYGTLLRDNTTDLNRKSPAFTLSPILAITSPVRASTTNAIHYVVFLYGSYWVSASGYFTTSCTSPQDWLQGVPLADIWSSISPYLGSIEVDSPGLHSGCGDRWRFGCLEREEVHRL